MTDIFIPAINQTITFSVGKNAEDNTRIVTHAEDTDLWFHVENESSSHVIAHIPNDHKFNKKQKQKIVVQGALLCKMNSRFKSQNNVPICFTEIKNITTTSIPGQVHTTNTKTISI